MVEQCVVDLGGGSGIREGGETRGKSPQGQLLHSPYRPRCGRGEERPPVGCFGGFNGLEVALLGEVGGCPVGREVGGAGLPCGGVEFLSEEGKQGGPPGLRAVGGALGGGVGGEEGGEAHEVSVEPGFERKSSGKRRGRRNSEVLE